MLAPLRGYYRKATAGPSTALGAKHAPNFAQDDSSFNKRGNKRGPGGPHYSRSGDRRYKSRETGATNHGRPALQITGDQRYKSRISSLATGAGGVCNGVRFFTRPRSAAEAMRHGGRGAAPVTQAAAMGILACAWACAGALMRTGCKRKQFLPSGIIASGTLARSILACK